MSEQPKEHPHYPVTELELYQIRNDCKYPDRKDCNGCEGENSDCCFSTNHLIDEILTRSRPHPAPAQDQKAPICENCGLDSATCRMDMAGCLQAQNAAARKAREEYAKKVHDMCECVPLKEYAPDYDRGFHQAMTLVRLWCTQQQAGEQHE